MQPRNGHFQPEMTEPSMHLLSTGAAKTDAEAIGALVGVTDGDRYMLADRQVRIIQ